MTIKYTTNYGIAYADDQTALKDLGLVTQQVAASLDAAMGKAGYVPPDASSFAAEVAARTALSARQAPTIMQTTQTGTAPTVVANTWVVMPLTGPVIADGAAGATITGAAAGTFVATRAGLYQAEGFIPFVGAAVMTRIGARITKNGAPVAPGSGLFAAPAAVDLSAIAPVTPLTLAVGDIVRLEGFQAGTGTATVRTGVGSCAQLTVRQLTAP